ncbi:MAG: hypothetical protein QF675_11600, partial [SAR324 cluster bacterium]|nr:hypothetical protein [SAR324 cluster bacterium]
MTKWCCSIWKQRKARLPDSIQILPVRRNAATFQIKRIPWGQMEFLAGAAFAALARALAQPSTAALLTPKNP